MKKTWRPEGWDELELQTNSALAEKLGMPLGSPSVGMVQAYEAGADAMLKTLRSHSYGKQSIGDWNLIYIKPLSITTKVKDGVMAFIPADE